MKSDFRFALGASATPMRQLFHDVPREHAATGKLRSFFHHLQEFVFSFAANDSRVFQVNDEFASLEAFACALPRPSKFTDPRVSQLSFDYQASFRRSINC